MIDSIAGLTTEFSLITLVCSLTYGYFCTVLHNLYMYFEGPPHQKTKNKKPYRISIVQLMHVLLQKFEASKQ